MALPIDFTHSNMLSVCLGYEIARVDFLIVAKLLSTNQSTSRQYKHINNLAIASFLHKNCSSLGRLVPSFDLPPSLLTPCTHSG